MTASAKSEGAMPNGFENQIDVVRGGKIAPTFFYFGLLTEFTVAGHEPLTEKLGPVVDLIAFPVPGQGQFSR